MEYLASLGAARSKLLVGIPFYGQAYRLAEASQSGLGDPAAGPGASGEFTRQPGMLSYYEICHRLQYQRWHAGPGKRNVDRKFHVEFVECTYVIDQYWRNHPLIFDY